MEYEVSRQVDAPADRVWAALLEVASWPEWDTGVLKVEGAAVDGGKLKVWSEVSPERAFPVRVALDEPGRVMTWTGGMPLGLFRGVRTFRVTPAGTGSQLDVHERFTGPLVGLMSKQMPDLQPSFEKFADGIKAHSERD